MSSAKKKLLSSGKTSEFGAPTQLEKIDMIDYADLIVINKFERKGSEDALRQVQKQYQRSRELWHADLDTMPVHGTIASQFNDKGTNSLFAALIDTINLKTGTNWETSYEQFVKTQKQDVIIPNDRRYYLREITDTVRGYYTKSQQQVDLARKLFQLEGAVKVVKENEPNDVLVKSLESLAESVRAALSRFSLYSSFTLKSSALPTKFPRSFFFLAIATLIERAIPVPIRSAVNTV